MIFKTRDIAKQFGTVHDFGIQNLIVSGCSFTYNNSETAAVTWPYYLRDLGGFDQVWDCSLPGAGNHHISTSLIWALENQEPDPQHSLVVVMWSGCDRDDFICARENINHDYPFRFYYDSDVMSGITGGAGTENRGNMKTSAQELVAAHTAKSRAIENYLYFCNTWHYLNNNGYRFVFLKFLDHDLPSRTKHFDIRPYLPPAAQLKLDAMMSTIPDPYSYAVKNDLLHNDDFHPSPVGHLDWTRNILLPNLAAKFD